MTSSSAIAESPSYRVG